MNCTVCNDLGVITVGGDMEFCPSDECVTLKEIKKEANVLSEFVASVQIFLDAPITLKDPQTILNYRSMRTSMERYIEQKQRYEDKKNVKPSEKE